MRDLLLVACVLVGMLAVPTSSGAAGADREIRKGYVSSGFFVGGHGNLGGQRHHLTVPEESPAVVFAPKPGERFVQLEIEDQSGRPSVVLVHQDVPEGHHVDDLEFCAAGQFIPLRSAAPLEVRLFSGVCHNHKYGLATTGTITATFSR